MGIHNLVLEKVRASLQATCIDDLLVDDTSRAGVVMIGPMQGNPDPDQARISITIFENDPDGFYGKAGASSMSDTWVDEVTEVECGGSATWKRRFTIKARCLFVNTGEEILAAREIASKLRDRIEGTLFAIRWTGVISDGGEYVARGVFADSLKSEEVQAGGPPDAYDYHIKVRFEVLTTIGVIL